MSSTDNTPSLALSDIMHHMSPSPVPPDEHVTNVHDYASGEGSKDTNMSTENYTHINVIGVRQKLNELGYPVAKQQTGGDNTMPSGISSREKELLDIVLSLMKFVPVDPAQLERQAETISDLIIQRDFLIRQAEEDRERWNSERESWDRTAEALLSERNKPSKSEDVERVRASYEAEIKALREKLQEAQRRQSSLEAELLKLKPMLLMQPYPSSRQDKGKGREVNPTRSQPNPALENRGTGESQNRTQQYANYPKNTANTPATASTSKAPAPAPPPASAEPNAPPQQRRSRERTGTSKSQSKKTGPPLMTDAHSELLLSAAKRIGRKRVATVAGMNQYPEREKEALAQDQEQMMSQKDRERMEQERQERIANGTFGGYYRTGPEASTSSPLPRVPHIIPVIGTSPLRTPKRGGIHFSNFASATNNLAVPPESPLVYVNMNPVASTYGSPWGGSGVMGTPGQIKATLNRQNGRSNNTNTEKAPASNPPTPLASLLDAALMIDGDGRAGSKTRRKTNGKGRAQDEPPDSPVPPPKRRRISGAGSGNKNAAGNAGHGKGLDRVRTALDVLADQADQASAAFNETDQSDRRANPNANANGSGSTATLEGKGKAKETPDDHYSAHDEGVLDMAEGNSQHVEEPGAVPRESGSTTPHGRGRGTRRESAVSRTAPPTASTTTVSSRPIRQASRRRAALTSTTSSATRGAGRGRGRPKGSSSSRSQHGRSESDAGSSRIISPPGSRIISAPGPRVIAPPSGYSPLDEAIALSSSSIAAKAKETGKKRSDNHEHAQSQPQHRPQAHEQRQSQSNEPKIGGLRPVVRWGRQDMPSSFDSDSSPIRGNERRPSRDDNIDDDKDNNDGEMSRSRQTSEPPASLVMESTSTTTESAPVAQLTPEILRETEDSSTVEFTTSINGYIRDPPSASPPSLPQPAVTASPQMKISVVAEEDVDAEAEADDDQDAEGEQEDDDDDEGEGEIVSTRHPSRSRSPPPPGPPPPGPPDGSSPGSGQDDEHDPDADAEGEVEFDDNEDHSGGGTGAAPVSSRRAAANNHEHGLARHPLTSCTLSDPLVRTRYPTSPYSVDLIPISTCAASTKHTPLPVDISGLSDMFSTAALGLILWVFANVPAKHESRHGWWMNESQQFRVFPVKRPNKFLFKWRKVNGSHLGQIIFTKNNPHLMSLSESCSSMRFDSRSSKADTLTRPPSSFVSPWLEVVS